MDVLGKLHDGLILVGCGVSLLLKIEIALVDLGLFFREFFTELVHPLHLSLEHLFEVEELIFQVLYPLLLRLQRSSHLCGTMRQDMLRLLQILYLELVLVEVSLPLFELLSDLLPLLLKHIDLLDLLLQLSLYLLLLLLRSKHQQLCLIAQLLETLLLSLNFLLVC